MLGEVAEEDGLDFGVEVRGGEVLTHHVVREVAFAAHDALLDGPGIGSDFEHVEVMVRFKNHEVGASEVPFDRFGQVAEVHRNRDFDTSGLDGVADGIDSVVRDGEALDVEVTDGEAGTGLVTLDRVGDFAVPIDGRGGAVGEVDRGFELADERGEPAGMIAVLVGDEDGVDVLWRFADGGQALNDFAAAEASVNQDARTIRPDKQAVACARGGENADLEQRPL